MQRVARGENLLARDQDGLLRAERGYYDPHNNLRDGKGTQLFESISVTLN